MTSAEIKAILKTFAKDSVTLSDEELNDVAGGTSLITFVSTMVNGFAGSRVCC